MIVRVVLGFFFFWDGLNIFLSVTDSQIKAHAFWYENQVCTIRLHLFTLFLLYCLLEYLTSPKLHSKGHLLSLESILYIKFGKKNFGTWTSITARLVSGTAIPSHPFSSFVSFNGLWFSMKISVYISICGSSVINFCYDHELYRQFWAREDLATLHENNDKAFGFIFSSLSRAQSKVTLIEFAHISPTYNFLETLFHTQAIEAWNRCFGLKLSKLQIDVALSNYRSFELMFRSQTNKAWNQPVIEDVSLVKLLCHFFSSHRWTNYWPKHTIE